MLEILEGYKPKDLGLDGYAEFRKDPQTGQEVQLEVIEFAAYCDKRFAAVSAPTGFGKQLIALSLMKLLGARSVALTGTKGLQDQYKRDGEQYGLCDVRGRGNYQCGDFANLDCRGGVSVGCRYTNGRGCEYERVKQKARNAESVSANYAYWLAVNDKATGLERGEEEAALFGENPVELLILDEAHEAPQILSDYLACRVYEGELRKWIGDDVKRMSDDIQEWKTALKNEQVVENLRAEIRTMGMELAHLGKRATKEHVVELHKLEGTLQKAERISGMQDDWVCEKREGTRWGRQWNFDVIWPGRYAEQYLFCGVEKIVVMSATLRPKTMSLLGVGREDYEFREWQRIFPANRHPIYSIPARVDGKDVRVDRRTTDQQLRAWVDHIDLIIDMRLDRKGIIQTVSYDRQKFFMEHSRHAGIMMGNTQDPESDSAAEAAERFKKMPAPCLLVSPSFNTGWDFPGDSCEFIVICKVPFKPNRGKVQKAREERDKQYGAYQAMIELVQGAGRGMRSAEDRCEVFLCDGHVSWFLNQNKALAPDWFVKGVRRVMEVPKAPEKL